MVLPSAFCCGALVSLSFFPFLRRDPPICCQPLHVALLAFSFFSIETFALVSRASQISIAPPISLPPPPRVRFSPQVSQRFVLTQKILFLSLLLANPLLVHHSEGNDKFGATSFRCQTKLFPFDVWPFSQFFFFYELPPPAVTSVILRFCFPVTATWSFCQ